VVCPCGHALSLHDYAGCSGERLRSCPCGRDKRAAFEAAIDTAGSISVYGPGRTPAVVA